MKQTDKNQKSDSRRVNTMAVSVIAALVFILVLHIVLPKGDDGKQPQLLEEQEAVEKKDKLSKDGDSKESQIAALLLDRSGLTYPFSIQNIMWIVFFIGVGELGLHFSKCTREHEHLRAGYLPDDSHEENMQLNMLLVEELQAIHRRVKKVPGGLFLTKLIQRLILQFQIAGAAQAHALLNSSMDLFLHEIELRYNMLRYIMWLLPTLGFIGTVRGISDALAVAGNSSFDDSSLLLDLTTRLALAFNTTLLALIMAGILVFAMHIIQGREERALNMAGQYCLDNLINRISEDKND